MLDFLKNRFQNIRNRISLLFENPEAVFTAPLVLALTIIGIRFLSILFDHPDLRILIWLFGLILIFLLWSFRDNVVAGWLNNYFVQLFMIICLKIEDIVYGYKGLQGYFFLFFTVFDILHVPALLFYAFGVNPFVWYWVLLIMFATYSKLRTLFIFPDPSRISVLKNSNYMSPIDDPEKFNWDLVIKNMNTVTVQLHRRPVQNRLTAEVGRIPLRYAGMRYMSSWKEFFEMAGKFSKPLQIFIQENPKKAGVAIGVVGGSAFVGTGFMLHQVEREQTRQFEIAIQKNQIASRVQESAELEQLLKTMQSPSFSKMPPLVRDEIANTSLAFLQKIKGRQNAKVDFSLGQSTISSKTKAPSIYEEPDFFSSIVKKGWLIFESLFIYLFKNKIL